VTQSAPHPAPVRDERLAAIARIADAAEAPEIARDARAVAERLDEGRFFVAVLGQFASVIAISAPRLPRGSAVRQLLDDALPAEAGRFEPECREPVVAGTEAAHDLVERAWAREVAAAETWDRQC
jgi:hypothetical protein